MSAKNKFDALIHKKRSICFKINKNWYENSRNHTIYRVRDASNTPFANSIKTRYRLQLPWDASVNYLNHDSYESLFHDIAEDYSCKIQYNNNERIQKIIFDIQNISGCEKTLSIIKAHPMQSPMLKSPLKWAIRLATSLSFHDPAWIGSEKTSGVASLPSTPWTNIFAIYEIVKDIRRRRAVASPSFILHYV